MAAPIAKRHAAQSAFPGTAKGRKRMDDLSLDHFALFVQLAAAASLSTVARDRNVPVSRISRALGHIEAQSGMRLFRRNTQGLSLTGEGEVFLEHAQRFLAERSALEDGLSSRGHAVGGRVRISIAHLLAEYVVIPRLAALRAQYPGLDVDLHISDGLADMAVDGIDILVRAGVEPGDSMMARRLGRHGRALYAAPAYLAAHGEPGHPDELDAHSLITNPTAPLHNRWTFLVDGRPVTRVKRGGVQADNSAAVVSLALAGAGIARINDVLGRELVRQGRLAPVLAGACLPGDHLIHAAVLGERRRAPKMRACLDWLKDSFAGFA
ncbi:MAG: LysR family transcriptional regulator [Aquabacterium sp.]|nr:MAG: LysR family transcriptional regulator [Aquabacterium sp.]